MAKRRGVRPLHLDDSGRLWASRGFRLFCSDDGGATYVKQGLLRPGFKHSLKVQFRLLARLFREGIHHFHVFPDGSQVAVLKSGIYCRAKGEQEFRKTYRFVRGSRPLNICVDEGNRLYFGEYFSNPERTSVHIFRSLDQGNTWSVVHTFPDGAVRHVHGVYWDSFRRGLWVLTGDLDHESGVYLTTDSFAYLKPVLTGSQRARAVSLIPLSDGVILPTDTEVDNNVAQWLDPATGLCKHTADLPGSVFYSTVCADFYIFATVVEPSDVNHSQRVYIYFSKDGQRWKILHQATKDRWHMRYFQYGTYLFPSGVNHTAILYAFGQAVVGSDGCMLVFDLKQAWQEREYVPEPDNALT
ncbi:beta propeller repeat protein [Oleiphilus messinensis]|nr:hypothetical protein [Oleiphilus messinensis]